MNDSFGIGIGAEDMPAGAKFVAQLEEVINFSIENDPDAFIFVRNWLMPGRKVDDAEAAHPEPDGSIDVIAFIVRSTMGDYVAHAAQDCRIGDVARLPADYSSDAAHKS